METPLPPRNMLDLREYAEKLYLRIGEAVILRRMEIEIGSWRPLENECHSNVAIVHHHSPSYCPVHGWLYFDFDHQLDRAQFLAHSALRSPSGELWDITPSRASQEYPFLSALESEKEYFALIDQGFSRLWHIK